MSTTPRAQRKGGEEKPEELPETRAVHGRTSESEVTACGAWRMHPYPCIEQHQHRNNDNNSILWHGQVVHKILFRFVNRRRLLAVHYLRLQIDFCNIRHSSMSSQPLKRWPNVNSNSTPRAKNKLQYEPPELMSRFAPSPRRHPFCKVSERWKNHRRVRVSGIIGTRPSSIQVGFEYKYAL